MGMIHSGPICDCALFWRGEAWMLENNMASFKVHLWYRFRDDILTASSDMDLFRKFLGIFRARVKQCWSCKVEEVSQKQVTMLDLDVCLTDAPGGGMQIGYKPFFKPTSVNTPLSISSCHHPRSHG